MSFGVIKKKNKGFTAFRYKIIGVVPSARRIYIAGDQTNDFFPTLEFRVSGSTGNNGYYRVIRSEFESSLNKTRITVVQHFTSSIVDGVVDILGKTIPWQTGDTVVVNSTKFLPFPLTPNTIYYVIRTGDTRFSLAESYNNAINGVAIQFTSPGDGSMTVAELQSTFRVLGGSNNTDLWFHYAIDKNDIRTFVPPQPFSGMQTFVNFIDGYSAYQQDQGLLQGLSDSQDFDPVTGRLVDWSLETERFMDWAFGLRDNRLVVNDSYSVIASPSTNSLTFAGASTPMWFNGTGVTLSSTGTMPAPLIAGAKYYVVLSGVLGQIKLSTSSVLSDVDSLVEITTPGSGTITITLYNTERAFPAFELNPQRNNIWIDTPLGVLSNVVDGPYSDIRIQQTIYDQYNRPISADKMTVYRQDQRSKITIRPEMYNDVEPVFVNNPYHYIHFGGGHMFVEGYEHFLLLNNYTVGGALVFDPFFGLKTDKFSVDYFEKADYTLRPTLGGYYLIDQKFLRNMEGSVSDMQNFYDILALSEATETAKHARALVGYQGKSQFLDLININSKSQFIFHRGMIQEKGSVNSVAAFINSRRFVDAKLDEFWAWKLDTFGDARTRVYPEVNLYMTDGTEDLRFEFLGLTESTTGSDAVVAEYRDSQQKNFNLVSFSDENRWNDFPEQKEKIGSPLFLDGEASNMEVIFASSSAPQLGAETTVQLWFNTSTHALKGFDPVFGTWSIDHSDRVAVQGTYVYLKVDINDDVRVINRIGTLDQYTTSVFNKVTQFTSASTPPPSPEFIRVNSELVKFKTTDMGGLFMLFTIRPAISKISPAKLIDNQTSTVIESIPAWHPAIGEHDQNAIRNIDIIKDTDPANYSITLNSVDNYPLNPWNQNEVGHVWWDTSALGYLPYYDDQIYTSVNDRIAKWGQLAPWASNDMYKWVASTVAPNLYDAAVRTQAIDASIANADKLTGTPRKTTFKRTRDRLQCTFVSGVTHTTLAVHNDDEVVFSTTGSLPTGLTPGIPYQITNFNTGVFSLIDPITGNSVVISGTGTGTHFITKSFAYTDWRKQEFIHDRVTAPFSLNLTNQMASYVGAVSYPFTVLPTTTPKVAWIPTDPSKWMAAPDYDTTIADTVDVYINGEIVDTGLTVNRSQSAFYVTLTDSLVLSEYDIIDIVRPIHTVTSDDLSYDPDVNDDGIGIIQWRDDYEYTTNVFTTGGKDTGGVTTLFYYFWVKDVATRDETIHNSLSPLQVGQLLTQTSSAYMIVQKPKDDPTDVSKYASIDYITDDYNTVPIMYRQVIVRNVMNHVDDNNRYMLRFTRDLTLRDDLNRYHRHVNIKDVHEKWVMFRRGQDSTIDRRLWDKLTESLVGFKYDNQNNKVRVPSLNRELYDATHNTSTRIGLGIDQSFTDRALGLSTIQRILNDPTIDFSPANIDEFFARHSFDTPASIQAAMDTIYTTFSSHRVNEIWFSVLDDSLSLRPKYEELMKTSWLALHGVRVLEVGGLFDD